MNWNEAYALQYGLGALGHCWYCRRGSGIGAFGRANRHLRGGYDEQQLCAELPTNAIRAMLNDDQPSFRRGNGEDRTVRAAQYTFGRAAA